MEDCLKIEYGGKRGPLRMVIPPGVHFVRYADDFVIVAPTKAILEIQIVKIKAFLKERGLEISEKKSKITTIADGFDFLSFTFIKKPYKYEIQKKRKLHPNYKRTKYDNHYLLIVPTKKKVQGMKKRLREVFESARLNKRSKKANYTHKGKTKSRIFLEAIRRANPIIVG